MGLPDRSSRADHVGALGLLHPACDRRDQLHRRAVGRRDPAGGPVGPARQRTGDHQDRRPAGRGRSGQPADQRRRVRRAGQLPRGAGAPHTRVRTADGRGHGPRVVPRRGQHPHGDQGGGGSRPAHRRGRRAQGQQADVDQIPGVRLVEQAVLTRAAVTGRGGARRCAADRLGRTAGRTTSLPRRVLGHRRHRDRRRRRTSASGAVRALPRVAGRCPW
ncbi:hypothetical protein KIPE111705_31980 [Kibdelosporangium persicum]